MKRDHWPENRLCRALGIESPIIQAPMAGVSTLDMALAVNQAGGLGSLACATLDPASLRELLSKALTKSTSESGSRFNVNFFAHTPPGADRTEDRDWLQRLGPYYEHLGISKPDRLESGVVSSFDDATCVVVEEMQPEIVSFHFGLPAPDLVARVKHAGSIVMSSATTVDEALSLEERGCDVIIAQGYEAGGHRGMFIATEVHSQLGTLALVPQIVDAVDLPVVAAGGIADSRGIVAAFALGACGVQLGTAFLFTREASISPLHLETLRRVGQLDTSITNLFSGRPARCVVNKVMEDLGAIDEGVSSFPSGFAAMAPLRNAAERRNVRDFSAHYCGQSAPLDSGRERSAADLVRGLAEDARRGFAKLSR